MKKHSKILSLVLSVILLLGVFAISSSAALIADDGDPLTPVYEEGQTVETFKKYDFETSQTLSGANQAYAGTITDYVGKTNISKIEGDENNHYWNLVWTGGKGWVDVPLQSNYTTYKEDDRGDIDHFTYMVASVDVTSFGNYFTEDFTKPDYISRGFYLYMRGVNSSNESTSKTLGIYFVESNGDWYASTSTSLSSSATKLKINGGLGEWNNFTWVVVANGTKTTFYLYTLLPTCGTKCRSR